MRKTNENMKDTNPEKIFETCFAFAPSRVLVAGVDLEVFTHIANGNHTAEEIAKSAHSDIRAMEILLNSLVSLQFLTKSNGKYGLSEISEKFLVKGSKSYYGDFVPSIDLLWEPWGNLTEVVRTGKPFSPMEREEGETLWEKLVMQLVPLSYPGAKVAVEKLKVGDTWKGINVLDVCAGSGSWGTAFAERDPNAKVTFQDWPAILNITKKFVNSHGINGRATFLPGDLRKIDFGENKYDLSILGHICHSEGEKNTRILFSKMYKSLKKGGKILIADMIADDERSSAVFPLLFAVNMLVNFTEGNTFTMSEYTAWLSESGFKDIGTIDVPGPSPLIVARK
jgi:ubiquinone/menaquinone biosynthesis C-methylase UbiE